MSAPKNISLLPREGFEYSIAGKTLVWASNAGRAIVVITELIVMLAFISRFWLDRQRTDIDQKIEQQVVFIKASQQVETQFRSVQNKLLIYVDLTQKQPNLSKTMVSILETVPPAISVSQVTMDKDQAQIIGIALSESGLEQFIDALSQQKLGTVQINDVLDGGPQGIGIQFNLSVANP